MSNTQAETTLLSSINDQDLGIKIKQRRWREWLDAATKRGFDDPSWQAFWLEVLQDAEMCSVLTTSQ